MIYAFGDVTLDEERWQILRENRPVPAQVKAFEVLLHLLKNRDRMVTRTELFDVCWPEICVSDGSLTRCISRIREAINQPKSASSPIFTIRGRGYRFVAPVRVHGNRSQAGAVISGPPVEERMSGLVEAER